VRIAYPSYVRGQTLGYALVRFRAPMVKLERMRRLATLPCLIALAAGVAACGGDDSSAGDTPAAAATMETTATAPATTPTTPSAGGGTVELAAVKSCLEGAGLTVGDPQPDEADGLQGKGFQVPLGEADFDEPAKPGTFKFFGYVYVFDTPANAEKFDGLVTGSRFQGGEVHENAYLGYNTDSPKLPQTPNGGKFISCINGG
jgi:hypothetical protein